MCMCLDEGSCRKDLCYLSKSVTLKISVNWGMTRGCVVLV